MPFILAAWWLDYKLWHRNPEPFGPGLELLGTGMPRYTCSMSERAYRPHRAWESPLYHAVAEHLATFLAGRQLHGRPVPFFIVRDFRAFLDCGVPTHGFLRVLIPLHVPSAGRARAAGGTARWAAAVPSEATLARRDR